MSPVHMAKKVGDFCFRHSLVLKKVLNLYVHQLSWFFSTFFLILYFVLKRSFTSDGCHEIYQRFQIVNRSQSLKAKLKEYVSCKHAHCLSIPRFWASVPKNVFILFRIWVGWCITELNIVENVVQHILIFHFYL